jgi:Fibronectin type III domain
VLGSIGGRAWRLHLGALVLALGVGGVAVSTTEAAPASASASRQGLLRLSRDVGVAPRGVEAAPRVAGVTNGGEPADFAISCASTGNCSAGGAYNDGSGGDEADVVDETGGTWGRAEEVTGTAALNDAGSAEAAVTSISCSSAGNCGAGGYYREGQVLDPLFQAFMVDEVGGVWDRAEEVPGTAALNEGGDAGLTSISCSSAGNCSAAGSYLGGSGQVLSFVVDEVGGTWGSAQEAPGTEALAGNGAGTASLDSISCSSAGNCSATGSYSPNPTTRYGWGPQQAYLIDEVDGAWGAAVEVPGTATLNVGGWADFTSISCPSMGYCSAAGFYSDAAYREQPATVDEAGGTWGTAQAVPGIAALNTGTFGGEVDSISCSSAGNCSAAGSYEDHAGHQQDFVAGEVARTWGSAEELPGTAALNVARWTSISCSSAGNCSAAGDSFVADEIGGTWGSAEAVPDVSFNAISCSSSGNCGAVGIGAQSVVENEVGGTWGGVREVTGLTPPGPPSITSVAVGTGAITVSWSPPDSSGGVPISGYTVRLSPGARTCATRATRCTFGSLTPRRRYSVAVVASNATPIAGAASAVVDAYPQTVRGPTLWPGPFITAVGTSIHLAVIGGRPGAVATISVPHEPQRSCRLNLAGQCTTVTSYSRAGAWKMIARSEGRSSAVTLHVVEILVQGLVRVGDPLDLKLTSCPGRARVRVNASYFDVRNNLEHRSYRAKATMSGSAIIRIPTKGAAQGTLTLSVFVDGVMVEGTVVTAY